MSTNEASLSKIDKSTWCMASTYTSFLALHNRLVMVRNSFLLVLLCLNVYSMYVHPSLGDLKIPFRMVLYGFLFCILSQRSFHLTLLWILIIISSLFPHLSSFNSFNLIFYLNLVSFEILNSPSSSLESKSSGIWSSPGAWYTTLYCY